MDTASAPSRTLWIGTFPVAGIGTEAGLGEGIWRTEIDLATGALAPAEQACVAPSPSFLTHVPGTETIWATGEAEPDGELTAWSTLNDGGEEALVPVADLRSLGSAPTHVIAIPGLVVACNYGDGTVTAVPVGRHGEPIGPPVAHRHSGSGPDLERQESSHAHSAVLTPDGTTVLVCDLGTDELRRYGVVTQDSEGLPALADDGVAQHFTPGTGPRHSLFRAGAPSYIDVVTELSGELVTLSWDGDNAAEVHRVPARPTGATLPSHLARSTDSRFLYVANRGPGTISVFELPGPDAAPEFRGEVETGSTWPRHFAVIPGVAGREFLVVAGERAGALHVLVRDPAQVLPRRVDAGAEVPSPAFVLPA